MVKLALFLIGLVLLGFMVTGCHSDGSGVEMHLISADGVGKAIGKVTISETPYGTVFTPQLKGLSPGLHGFHLHENGSCEPGEEGGRAVAGLAAGGHYDPDNTGTHRGPYAEGHLGDLPALYADQEGTAQHPVLAPRVKLADLKGRALVIHAHGDNYADRPEKLGGGGERVACGVVPGP